MKKAFLILLIAGIAVVGIYKSPTKSENSLHLFNLRALADDDPEDNYIPPPPPPPGQPVPPPDSIPPGTYPVYYFDN